MEVFVAKQPVYNIREEIVGYELFYRKDANNFFPYIDGDQATEEVIINSFLNIGMDRISQGKRCSIHFTENLLDKKLPTLFNPDDIVVKIANKVELNNKLINNCKELKELGYYITINESILPNDLDTRNKILNNIDSIEVDFSYKRNEQLKVIEEIALHHNIQLLADKIETLEAFEEAKNRGYQLFQGYYFSEPVIESTYDIPTIFSSFYQTFQNGVFDRMDEDELVELLAKDLSLSMKLLRLINKNSINNDVKVCSIRRAIRLVGIDEIKKWIQILSSARNCSKEQNILSTDLTRQTLTRAKFCETIAKQKGIEVTSGYYMAGLLSTLEAIVSNSMEEILDGLPLSEKIHDALVGKENELKVVLDLVEAVEHAKWKEISDTCKKLNLTEIELFRIYAESLNWTTQMVHDEQVALTGVDPLLLH